MQERKASVLSRMKTLPPIVFIAIAMVIIGSALVLADMTFSQHIHISKGGADMSLVVQSGSEDIVLYGDDTQGTVVYRVTNIGPTSYTVTVTENPAAVGATLSLSDTSFVLAPGAYKDVTATVTLTDPEAGDCYPEFTHT